MDRSHSRPHVSDDNPYSEAQFKTLKYCPAFPERFGSIEDARAFCEAFFAFYNHEHRHSGIGYHTPASVHYGTAAEVRAQRGRDPRGRLRAQPGTVPPLSAAAAEAADRGLDQRAGARRRARFGGARRRGAGPLRRRSKEGVMTIEPMRLDAEDAMELGELLGFIAGWLASERPALGPSLQRYVGNRNFGVEELRTDLRRFEFLLGGGDGRSPFEDDES